MTQLVKDKNRKTGEGILELIFHHGCSYQIFSKLKIEGVNVNIDLHLESYKLNGHYSCFESLYSDTEATVPQFLNFY